jgi:peptidoglycan/xylan/chitin deacetylase (PgdA/CDA1 family)
LRGPLAALGATGLAAALLALGVAAAEPAPAGAGEGILTRCWTAEQLRDGGAAYAGPRDPPVVSPLPPLPDRRRGLIRSVRPVGDEKLLALTFDLCESAGTTSGYDAPLVAYLRDQDVRATFFAGGKWLHSHPEAALQLMADPRFEIGNHSWSHKDFRGLAPAVLDAQIRETQTEYARLRGVLARHGCVATAGSGALDAVPAQPVLFRFPYGRCDAAALAAVARAGLVPIQWSIVTGDPAKGQGAGAIARAILDHAQPGAIVVAHANGRGWHTAEAMRKVVPELRRRGYRFVTVSELLASGEPVIADRCDE